jgi:hypothetical protein
MPYHAVTCSVHPGQLNLKKENNMNTKNIALALAVPALLVAAVAVVAVRLAVGVDGLIGFGAVAALVAVAVTDYRLNPRRVTSAK